MQAMHFAKMLEMILILVLGGQQPRPSETSPDLRLYVQHEVPLYIELDPGALVDAAATVPELKRALAVTANRDAAAAWVAEQTGATPAAVKEAFTGIRRVGFWLLNFGEDDNDFRAMLVIERGDGKSVLPGLIEGNTKIPRPDPNNRNNRREGYVAASYNGVTIHGLRGRRRPHLWATEHMGKIAVATDQIALQSFLLNGKSVTATAARRKLRARTPGSVLWAEANGSVALNQFVSSLGQHDLHEIGLISSFFDFPAWREATLSLTKDKLDLQVHIDPASKLTAILAPPAQPPALLSVLPNECDLALVVSLKDPDALWSHIKSSLADMAVMQGRPERQDRLEKEFRQEVGVDIKTDIVDNIAAGGVLVPVLKSERDIERNFVVIGEARDAARAEQALTRFVARAMRGGMTPTTVGNAKIWSADDGKAALVGKFAMLGPASERGCGVDSALKTVTGKSSEMSAVLPKHFPDATSFAVFNPAVLFKGKDVGRLLAGLSFRQGSLKLSICYSMAKVAGAFTETVEAAILQGKKAQAVNNLRLVAKAAQLYLSDYAKYPANFDQMVKYAANDKSLFVSPVSGKPYVFNPKIAGLQVGTIPDRNTTVLAHESPAGLDVHGGGHVVYLSGNVEWIETARFKRVVGIQ